MPDDRLTKTGPILVFHPVESLISGHGDRPQVHTQHSLNDGGNSLASSDFPFLRVDTAVVWIRRTV